MFRAVLCPSTTPPKTHLYSLIVLVRRINQSDRTTLPSYQDAPHQSLHKKPHQRSQSLGHHSRNRGAGSRQRRRSPIITTHTDLFRGKPTVSAHEDAASPRPTAASSSTAGRSSPPSRSHALPVPNTAQRCHSPGASPDCCPRPARTGGNPVKLSNPPRGLPAPDVHPPSTGGV